MTRATRSIQWDLTGAGGLGGSFSTSLVGPFRGVISVLSLGRSFDIFLLSINVTRVSAGISCVAKKKRIYCKINIRYMCLWLKKHVKFQLHKWAFSELL